MAKRKGIMLCYPFEEKRLAKWNPPYLVQPKLDGERCRAIYFAGKVTLLSSQNNEILSVPHINKALEDLDLADATELDGELYVHGADFEELHSIIGRTVNLHSDYKEMEYHIFDIVIDKPQAVRMLKVHQLGNIMILNGPVRTVPYIVAMNLDDIMQAYDSILKMGYEGIIVREKFAPYMRKRSTFMMKFKPKKSDVYKVVGYKEEVSKDGEPKGRLGALICVSDDETEFSVGSGLTDSTREDLWGSRDSLKGRFVRIEYQHITPGRRVPRFPIYGELLPPAAGETPNLTLFKNRA